VRAAVLQFPGSNCDQDALHALRGPVGIEAEYVWHSETSLQGFDLVFVPGGFSYGDYLRCGAIAARSPIMQAVVAHAEAGGYVIGVCNGFQVICEAGLLPGALLLNRDQKFICEDVWLRAENSASPWTSGVEGLIRIPIAHGEGRYAAHAEDLKMLNDEGRVAFRYVSPKGEITEEANVNGSAESIAGVLSANGRVLGMMPHPERACLPLLGGVDGMQILSWLNSA
jgi:phosphoribosylformylglycinamidine synthase